MLNQFDPGYDGDDEIRSMHSIVQIEETVCIFRRTRSEGYAVCREYAQIGQSYPDAKLIDILCFADGSYQRMLTLPINTQFRVNKPEQLPE